MNLYVHVPFCIKKCNYCAFHSVCPKTIDWDGYIDGVLQQLDEFQIGDYEIDTVFFGGGTPSLIPVKYAEKIRQKLRLALNVEWTVEANPETLGSLELKDWKDLGLTRLSIGMQSFDNHELEFLGRVHTAKDGLELLDRANNLGLRTSMDFIYGLSNQTTSNVIRLCERINDINLVHASLYELTIEKGTPFRNLVPVSESNALDMYQAIQNSLKLARYEISNYGDPCLHNRNVWAGEQYIGVGESAAGRIMRAGVWYETKIINGRIIKSPLTLRKRANEMVITGLRTTRGVVPDALPADVINWDFVDANPEYFCHGQNLKMTDAGFILLDGLLSKIIF